MFWFPFVFLSTSYTFWFKISATFSAWMQIAYTWHNENFVNASIPYIAKIRKYDKHDIANAKLLPSDIHETYLTLKGNIWRHSKKATLKCSGIKQPTLLFRRLHMSIIIFSTTSSSRHSCNPKLPHAKAAKCFDISLQTSFSFPSVWFQLPVVPHHC